MPGAKHGTGLSRPGFTRGLLSAAEQAHVMEAFAGDGSVSEVLGVIGDGKEATVYACRTRPSTGVERAVAKVYRAERFRAFAGGADYHQGHAIGDARAARAIRGRTRVGKLMRHGLWIEREWQTLGRLWEAGADVPEPYLRSSDAILMEYIGDETAAAPLLRSVRLERDEAEHTLQRLLRNVRIFLARDRVHGDLSAYNVLYQRGRVTVIDLPQAVDARTSPNAYRLLQRDVRNLCRGFARHGVRRDPEPIARDLWSSYQRGSLTLD
jgi:RIO kinase 1